MFNLTTFTVNDMVVASAELRQATAGAATMEDAGRGIVTYFRQALCGTDGQPAVVLARLFQTVRFERLTPQLRAYAQARMPDQRPPAGTHCLTLLATDGEHPNWRDRRASIDHQSIPLSSPQILKRAPLVLAAMDQLLTRRAAPPEQQHPYDGHGPGDTPGGAARVDSDVFHIAQAAGSRHLGQQFVHNYRIASAVALSGTLIDGDVFTLVLYSRVPVASATTELFRTLASTARLALLPYTAGPLFAPPQPVPAQQGGDMDSLSPAPAPSPVSGVSAVSAGAVPVPGLYGAGDRQRRLEQETRIVETLYSVGQSLARELDLRKLVQQAIEAAASVVGAQIGVFFYTLAGSDGQPQTRFALAGTPARNFERFPMPRRTDLFGPEPPTSGVLRLADVTADPRYGALAPYRGMPAGHPPVRSYLAVPVRTAAGETAGVFYFGHARPGVFSERDEELAKGIAAQAAAALDNARLYRQERDNAVELQRSLLPASPPAVPELDIAFKYLPGARGTRVGGDWFDVIPLSASRTALVIGDVMGRGLKAAAVMGQLRTAVRAYAVMDLPPAQVMHQLNRLVCGMETDLDAQIVTCVYAVYDPAEATVRWANAGHVPPAMISPTGQVDLLEADLGIPLGIDDAVFDEQTRALPPGSRLLLYTDGLIERHDASLSERLTLLCELLARRDTGDAANAADVAATCERLTTAMLTGEEHDDVALLMVHTRPVEIDAATLDLPPEGASARGARKFVRDTLDAWDLAWLAEDVNSVVTEMVTNACEHAGTAVRLRLRRHPGRVIVEVFDQDGRIPRPAVTQLLDERHRGFTIIASLSRRWGARPTDAGKVVWAEIDALRPPADPDDPDSGEQPVPAQLPDHRGAVNGQGGQNGRAVPNGAGAASAALPHPTTVQLQHVVNPV